MSTISRNEFIAQVVSLINANKDLFEGESRDGGTPEKLAYSLTGKAVRQVFAGTKPAKASLDLSTYIHVSGKLTSKNIQVAPADWKPGMPGLVWVKTVDFANAKTMPSQQVGNSKTNVVKRAPKDSKNLAINSL